MSHQASPLAGVEVYIFDVFGTVVDWYGNITKALAAAAPEGINEGMTHLKTSMSLQSCEANVSQIGTRSPPNGGLVTSSMRACYPA